MPGTRSLVLSEAQLQQTQLQHSQGAKEAPPELTAAFTPASFPYPISSHTPAPQNTDANSSVANS